MRHDLIRVADWPALFGRCPELASPEVRQWAERGDPLVGRRARPGEAGVPAGLALPGRGRRIALTLRRDEVARVESPPALQEVIARLPRAWRAACERLVGIGARFGMPRVFGSAMWECVTGHRYIDEASDLDLLWRAGPEVEALLETLDRLGCRRLDGEILFALGGVQWRELWQTGASGTVLVKGERSVAMIERATLLRTCG